MTDPDPDESVSPSTSADPGAARPDWVGFWRVRRWDEAEPSVPTYYVATTESWDVVKRETGQEPHVAAHPILEIDGQTIVLKDEGTPDEDAERWRPEVDGDTLRVTARTGPHAESVGVAERMATDPREMESDVPTP
ncbi:hypothetical protein [Salinibacter altiplanensis]|uniref:hypothetical protein n=1 Tax=Salinibacter altiplanensis TaxID=1803181 RepID=UPI001F17E644|nr:hypothetical protein [Salinibacter altiplanensis]